MTIVNLIVKSFFSFALLYLYCEIGEKVSMTFAQLKLEFDEFKFYTLSIDLQRMLPIIAGAAQHPPILYGFGNFPSSRETFKAVSVNYRINCILIVK